MVGVFLLSELSQHEQAELSRLLNLQFVFVTGKGGVGKSSVSAAIALSAAAHHKRACIVYPGSSKPAEQMWETALTDIPKRVAPGIDAIAINPETAMKQYVGEALGSTRLASVLFHHRVARGLLMGIPGPRDWAILGRAWSLTKSGAKDRNGETSPYDLVILDAPASGDGSGMLRVPQVLLELAPGARLRKDAENCLKLLQDGAKSRVVFVTLAEELSLAETEENLAVVRGALRMPVGPLFINRIVPERFSQKDRELILTLPEPVQGPTDRQTRANLVQNASYIQATRERIQESYLKRVDGWDIPTIRLPRLTGDMRGPKAIKKLQLALAEGH